MNEKLELELARELEGLTARRRERSPRTVGGPAGVLREVDGQLRVLIACSNDYLGLAGDPRVCEAAARGARDLGAGATGSPLVTGTTTAHRKLARAVAEFRGAEAALLFPSGYQANVGVLSALLGREDLVLADRLVHGSVLDGCRLSGAKLERFQHNEPEHLRELLVRAGGARYRRRLIVVEGVYSMEGDICQLPELLGVARAHDVPVMLDDAHGCGVMGEHGHGTDEHFGLAAGEVDVYLATFGKAFGAGGAFVAGSTSLIRCLTSNARAHLLSTASPPAVVAAATCGLEVACAEPGRRRNLHENAARARAGLLAAGLELASNESQIVPVLVGDDGVALAAAAKLLEQGIFVQAIRPPTVPEGSARLRVSLSASHTAQQIAEIVRALPQAVAAARAPSSGTARGATP